MLLDKDSNFGKAVKIFYFVFDSVAYGWTEFNPVGFNLVAVD